MILTRREEKAGSESQSWPEPWALAPGFPIGELENGTDALLQIPQVELRRVGRGTWCSWKKDGLGCCRGRAGVSGWTAQETLSSLQSQPVPG